jgi:hypothetical protein
MFRPSVFCVEPLRTSYFITERPLDLVLAVLVDSCAHAIMVTRRIVLGQCCVLFYCIGVLFSYSLLLFVHVCMCGLCLMIVSRRGAFGPVPGAAIF